MSLCSVDPYSLARNARESPILRLPSEVRQLVYRALLGDRLIHFNYGFSDDDFLFDSNETAYQIIFRESALWPTVCEEDCPEDSPGKEIKSSTDTSETYMLRPHIDCMSNGSYGRSEKLDLRALRCCRHMYTEANNILWTTNTFSFYRSLVFKQFMMTRSSSQKQLIQSLRIHYNQSNRDWQAWNGAFSMAVIQALKGLRRLRLCIEWDLPAVTIAPSKQSTQRVVNIIAHDDLVRLSTLPLEHVEISVKHLSRFQDDSDNEETLWTETDMKEYGDNIQRMLLSPYDSKIHAEK